MVWMFPKSTQVWELGGRALAGSRGAGIWRLARSDWTCASGRVLLQRFSCLDPTFGSQGVASGQCLQIWQGIFGSIFGTLVN